MLKIDPRCRPFVQHVLPSSPHLPMHKLCWSTKHHQTTSPKQHAIRELRANCTSSFVYSRIPSPKRYVYIYIYFASWRNMCYVASVGSSQCRATQLQRIETIATSQHPTSRPSSCFVLCARHPVEKRSLM